MSEFDLLPGMSGFVDNEDEDNWFMEDVSPGKNFFDATKLPDASGYQPNAENNQTYILHLVFPSYDELKRAVVALTGGERKALAVYAKVATINGISNSKKHNISWLELWESRLLGVVHKPKEIDEDEAQAPME